MPVLAPSHPAQTTKGAPALVVPFTRSAREHTETFADITQVLGASSVQLPTQDVPAYGFMRHLEVLVEATGGAGTATVATAEDAPWSAIQEVTLKDVNGAPIVGPLTGYDLYLVNKWGGYNSHSPDPKQRLSYTAPAVGANASGNFSFLLRIPVEISDRDALGSLANQNAASTYKLAITLAAASSVYTTSPTTLPSVRVRCMLGAWTQPTSADLRGNAQAQTPPAHGTTAYWSATVLNLPSGNSQPRLPRVGNYIRNLIFVYRDASGSRANAEAQLPDPFAIYWETRLLHQYVKRSLRDQMVKRTDLTGAIETTRSVDNGVYVQDFCHDFDGQVGRELRDGWLPTTQATRLEVQGTFGVAGSLRIITNDVAPNGEIFV